MSANPQAITDGQRRAIFGLANRAGHGDAERHAVIAKVTNGKKSSLRVLTFHEANLVIQHYNGQAFSRTPRRTVQYRRQKAGVEQLAQPAHLELMRSLAARRGMSDEGLEQLAARIIKHYPPRTTSETNKVIEALKSMNRREREEA